MPGTKRIVSKHFSNTIHDFLAQFATLSIFIDPANGNTFPDHAFLSDINHIHIDRALGVLADMGAGPIAVSTPGVIHAATVTIVAAAIHCRA